jgi:hypothetical protein
MTSPCCRCPAGVGGPCILPAPRSPLTAPHPPINLPPPISPFSITNLLRYIEWDVAAFVKETKRADVDGVIATFKSAHPRFSYVAIDPVTGLLTQAAEKRTISDNATCGVYFWRRGADFCAAAQETFDRAITINEQYFISSAYDVAIQRGMRFRPFMCDKMWPMNTPKDLEQFYQYQRDTKKAGSHRK